MNLCSTAGQVDTSFTIAYDLAMAANMAGAESVDYSLVWAMGHDDQEGTSTGTVTDGIYGICGGATTAPMNRTVVTDTGVITEFTKGKLP